MAPSPVRIVGHSEDEDAFAVVARADLRRCEQSSLNREAQSAKVSPDAFGTARRKHAADVFDDDEPAAGLHDNAPGVGPEIPLVVLAEPLSGKAVRLARDSANEAIHEATPWAAVKGGDIAP